MPRNHPRDRRSWHLSVLFMTTQLFQKLLFKLVLQKFSPKFPPPKKSNTFPTSFHNISNQITSPILLLNGFNTSYVKMSHIKSQICKPSKKLTHSVVDGRKISKLFYILLIHCNKLGKLQPPTNYVNITPDPRKIHSY